jgi:hypothetical protein
VRKAARKGGREEGMQAGWQKGISLRAIFLINDLITRGHGAG